MTIETIKAEAEPASKEWLEGLEAADRGLSEDKNPYEYEDPRWDEWNAGHLFWHLDNDGK